MPRYVDGFLLPVPKRMRGVGTGCREQRTVRMRLGMGHHADVSPVVGAGTTPTTHMPHRLCRVLAGRSRSQPVRSITKCLLQPVIPGRNRS